MKDEMDGVWLCAEEKGLYICAELVDVTRYCHAGK